KYADTYIFSHNLEHRCRFFWRLDPHFFSTIFLFLNQVSRHGGSELKHPGSPYISIPVIILGIQRVSLRRKEGSSMGQELNHIDCTKRGIDETSHACTELVDR